MKTNLPPIIVKWFRLKILLIVFPVLYLNSSFSQAITWQGAGVDTFSNNPASWSGGVLPTNTSDVVIPNGAAPLFVNANATWASVTFVGGNLSTRMTIGPGITLTVTGNITIQDASANRDIFIFEIFNSATIMGGNNTSGSGNRIIMFGNGNMTVTGDVSGCNLTMFGTSIATFGGNFTGGSVDAQTNNQTTINFNSTDAQTIAGGTYANITFSGGGTKTLAGGITIGAAATFSNGIVINSSPIFFDGSLGGSPSVTGASSSSFATGPVRWYRLIAAGPFIFPVGNQSAGYHPVTVDPLLITPTDFTVQYIRSSGAALGSVTAIGIIGVSNCEYWTIDRTIGGLSDITLTWGPGSGCNGTYITNPSAMRAVHFNGTNWDAAGINPGSGSAAAGSVSWLGVSIFSPFTLGTTSAVNPLPVGLTDLSASLCGNNNVCIYWKMASENNIDHFEIERSADGRQFNSIGNVNSPTNDPHSYTFRDIQPLNGKNYYRIKQVDMNGRISYSTILGVNNAIVSSFSASITPNPAGSMMNLAIEGVKEKENLRFEIMNTSGMTVYRENISAAGTGMVKTLDRSGLRAGLYFYKITRSANNETFTGKLVLQ